MLANVDDEDIMGRVYDICIGWVEGRLMHGERSVGL
jgi:hypothetical protein